MISTTDQFPEDIIAFLRPDLSEDQFSDMRASITEDRHLVAVYP